MRIMRSRRVSFAMRCAIAGVAALLAVGCGDDDGSQSASATNGAGGGGAGGGDTGGGGMGGSGGMGGMGGMGGGGGAGGGSASDTASATLEAKSGSNLSGSAMFTQANGMVTFSLLVENAPPGDHAVHIHDMGDCSDPDAMNAGGHWNPDMKDHGKWGTDPFHLGDIGNMTVGQDGKGSITLMTDLWSVGTGAKNDVVNHAIMVHANPDDFVTQPTGNAGSRIGCGVIASLK